jgi:hypothetical protein
VIDSTVWCPAKNQTVVAILLPVVFRQWCYACSLSRLLTTKLLKPVVATLKEVPSTVATLPIGASVEFLSNANRIGLVDVLYEGAQYSAMLQDLLDACSVEEVGRSAWP